jgi:hypothetical protein
VFVSEAVGRVADRSVQLCGGLGTSEELVVGHGDGRTALAVIAVVGGAAPYGVLSVDLRVIV